jgi:RNA polymerase sigma-70 factor (ECF subfamily)
MATLAASPWPIPEHQPVKFGKNSLDTVAGPLAAIVDRGKAFTTNAVPAARKSPLHSERHLPMPPSVTMADPEPATSEFTRLYRATIAPLRRYLTRFLGDPNEAQDVAHDAYVRVFPATTNGTAENPQALLYTTARNLAINRLKRRQIAPIEGATDRADLAASRGPGVVEQVMARQEWHLVQQAIADLPPGCRSVLLLRKVELLSHQEIADRLGIAVSTVEKQHARALRLLRAALVNLSPQSAPASAPASQEAGS